MEHHRTEVKLKPTLQIYLVFTEEMYSWWCGR